MKIIARFLCFAWLVIACYASDGERRKVRRGNDDDFLIAPYVSKVQRKKIPRGNNDSENDYREKRKSRALQGKGKGYSSRSRSHSRPRRRPDNSGFKMLKLEITNLSFGQPFSAFFVMVHNEDSDTLFEYGEPARPELCYLAENGDPSQLVRFFGGRVGVGLVSAISEDAPYMGGSTFDITIPVNNYYPLVTIAAMAINTNDCFVAINAMELEPDDVIRNPGIDAGSEENNELCSSVPGPACPMDSGNVASGNGEGVVHIHRGLHGIGDLREDEYDWRNPMIQVIVEEAD